MDLNKAKDVCKLGRGHETCRYLIMAPTGFECVKFHAGVKALLDKRVEDGAMNAQGDNCEGDLNIGGEDS